jgi:RNA polymerase sigma-70 factor, ECF subfamily
MGSCRFNALSNIRIHPQVSDRPPSGQVTGAAGDELAVLAAAQAGDEVAREQLVVRYLDDVFRLTSRILGDRELAQDATQDTFVNALGALHRFRGAASFRTWLLRIAVNAARTVGRRQVRRREVSLVLADNEHSTGPDAAVRAEQRGEAARVEVMLARLPLKQRLAVALRAQQGLSYGEIAGALDCSEGAARVNYHLGIKRLRELLNG